MEKSRLLIITHELDPYVAITEIANTVSKIPLRLHDEELEIRVLMPRFSTINERRHRLHEVVRLSGINIEVDGEDYPLRSGEYSMITNLSCPKCNSFVEVFLPRNAYD